MDFKNLSRWEFIAIVFSIVIFVVLSFVVVFKSDWLDSVIYGPKPEQYEVSLEPMIDYNEEILPVEVEEEPYANLLIYSIEEGRGVVALDLVKEANITGLELILEKEKTVEFEGDFVCVEPFECLFFDVRENGVSLFAVVPPSLIGTVNTGEIIVAEFIYSGSGSLYLTSKSEAFVSTVEAPEFNILNLVGTNFLLE